MIMCLVFHFLSTVAVVGAYWHELTLGGHDFAFQAKWVAWTGLAVDIVVNVVRTVAGSVLTFKFEFNSLVAYLLLVLGAFGALHVSLYEVL